MEGAKGCRLRGEVSRRMTVCLSTVMQIRSTIDIIKEANL